MPQVPPAPARRVSWSRARARHKLPQQLLSQPVLSSECTPHFQGDLGACVVKGLPPLVPALICCLEKDRETEP